MKKFLFGLLMVAALAMVSFPLLLVWQPLKYTEKSISPDESYTVVVKHSDGQWPFGPAKVKVSAKKSWFVRKTYWTEIADDGGQGQIEISWPDEETAQIILHGDEQRDEVITVTFSGEEIQLMTFREEVIPALPSSEPVLTPEPSPLPHEPVNIEVDVGDGEHTFWVELTEAEVGKTVNIYREKGDPKPFQSFADEEALLDLEMAGLTAEDVNFDGHMDFGYLSWSGGSYAGSAYYIWDPTAEQFVRDPYGLETLSLPKFDPEKQAIETWSHSASSYTIEFYRYLDGELTCVRRLKNWENNTDDYTATLTVEEYDRETGALKEVYREEQAEIGGVTYATTDEFRRWHDIDYPDE